jgi:hypothetical protein
MLAGCHSALRNHRQLLHCIRYSLHCTREINERHFLINHHHVAAPTRCHRYATYKLVQAMPGGDKLTGFTRILHRTVPDLLMEEVGDWGHGVLRCTGSG